MSRSLAGLLSAMLLAACAELGPRLSPEPTLFELHGRLAARYGEEAFSANIAWRHAPATDELLITNALGQGIARIVRDGDAVVLTTAEPREYRAADAEALTEEVLGFRLPLLGLADWVRAQPTEGSGFRIERAPDGQVRLLEQQGWRIAYLDYDEAGRPSRLRLAYPGIELRLVVNRWNSPGTPRPAS